MKSENHPDYGYVVVRLPAVVGNLFGDTLFRIAGEQKSEISYYGIDRDPWWDFSEMFYSGNLDERCQRVHRQIAASKLHSFSPGVCFDVEQAKTILALSNQVLVRNELVFVSLSGETSEPVERAVVLGFDCYIDGYGSLLRLGMFRKPELFRDFIRILNTNGLFDSIDYMPAYIDAYLQRCDKGGLEPIDMAPSDIDIYLVSRVSVDSTGFERTGDSRDDAIPP